MTPGGKALDITEDGAQRGARQCADAGDLTQLLNAHIGASEGIELMFDAEDLAFERTHFLQHVRESCTQSLRNLAVKSGERHTDLFLRDIDAERDRKAELAQNATQSIHVSLSGAHPLASQPVQGLNLLSILREFGFAIPLGVNVAK